MTKSQLIECIAQRTAGVARRDVEAIVNTVFDAMIDALRDEQRIEIRGFGSFAVKVREPRTGRNPKTGQRVDVPLRRAPYFTVGKELRDRLNPLVAPSATKGSAYSGSSSAERPEAFAAAPVGGGRYTIG